MSGTLEVTSPTGHPLAVNCSLSCLPFRSNAQDCSAKERDLFVLMAKISRWRARSTV